MTLTVTGHHEGDLRYSLGKLVFHIPEQVKGQQLFPKGSVGEQRSFSRNSSLKGKQTELEEWRLAVSLATLRPHPGDFICS